MSDITPAPSPTRQAGPGTIFGIILGNLLPMIGVLFLSWDAGMILILYWVENFIVGAYTLPRILMASGPPPAPGSVIGGTPLAGRIGVALFFIVHYGGFWLGHGVFAFLIAGQITDGHASPTDDGWGFWIAVAAMFVFQGIQFWQSWIQPRAWVNATPGGEMFKPYGRVAVLHLTVLLGAFGLHAIGAPTWTMLLLCVGKMILELGAVAGFKLRDDRPVDRST